MMRTSWLAQACSSLVLVACGSGAASPSAEQSYQASELCPVKSPAQWQAFVRGAIDDAAWVRTCSDQNDCQQLDPLQRQIEQHVASVLESCSDELQRYPRIAACTSRLRAFLPLWQAQHRSNDYGFVPGNAAYLAAQSAADSPPEMMEPPQALLAGLPVLADVAAAARDHGWPYLIHDSCLGGQRLFINVQSTDERFEQWLLLGVDPSAKSLSAGSILSFLAVQTRAKDGSQLPRVRAHFRDYVLEQAEAGFTLALPESYPGKCYACHGSGVRQLLPFPGAATSAEPVLGEPGYGKPATSDFAARRLAAMNERLASYGVPDWGDAIEDARLGPTLGTELGCSNCHDGSVRGPLTVFTSEGMLYQKVVEQLSMGSFDGSAPVPDVPAMALLQRERQRSPLSAAEERALAAARICHQADYQALVSSRLPALRAWAAGISCD